MTNYGFSLFRHRNVLRTKAPISHARQPVTETHSQMSRKEGVSQGRMATVTPSPRKGRPVRSARQVQPAPGYVDSSTLQFDSDDEGIESGSEHDSEDECTDESDEEDHHIAKKIRLQGNFKAQAKEASPPPPDSSCLAYYPETYSAIRSWNRMLNLPPPHPMSDAPTNEVPELDSDAPEPHAATTMLPQGVINKNDSFDETKIGFGKLPGEIRNKIYALVFEKEATIDFIDRGGFARSAAFLRVNKLVYNEARAFVYSQNRFCFGYNFAKSGEYFEPVWKELGWTHIRRFLTDIGPKNTGLIQNLGISFYDASQSGNPATTMDDRRFTYSEDVLWILDHLSKHGKILKLKLGFSGRRSVRMSHRDGDFLNALKGVKTDKLDIGDPKTEASTKYDQTYYSKVDVQVRDLLKIVMVRPLPLKDLDPRLKF